MRANNMTTTDTTYITKRKARRLYGKNPVGDPDLTVVEGHDTVHYYSTARLGIPANEGITEHDIRQGGFVKDTAWQVADRKRERRIPTQHSHHQGRCEKRRRHEEAQSVAIFPRRNQEAVQVYCDGACEPNPGNVYVGVYCADPRIEMARKMEVYGTNNVAECLAAIAALEECKRLNLVGVELLSDSALVIGWTRGSFEWKSATPFEYVPKIRQLLEDVQGRMLWVPGKKNLADKFSKLLIPTAWDRKLAAMKSGRDAFSKLNKPKLMEAIGVEAWNQIAAKIDKEKYQLSAARWFLRGLSLETAIRKVEAEREISHNYHNYYCALDD